MKVIKVKTKPSYEIVIGENLLSFIVEDLPKVCNFGKVAIVSDSKVASLYGKNLLNVLSAQGIVAELFTFPEGEASKNIETVVSLARALLKRGFDRKDLIVAFGGGVVGDVAGFLASLYLRGVSYIQVPTTLLAQVDSSVGGKTGVDLPEGKNLLGTFYQPLKVYIDTSFLKTLPLLEIKNGLSEIIKYGFALKRNIYTFLVKRKRSLYELRAKDMEYLIYHSLLAKAQVVSKDEKETGLRRVLNFGHTIGHAIEAYSEYKVPHGLAVSVGMAVEAKLSEILQVNEEPLFNPLKDLLEDIELPWKIRDLGIVPKENELLNLL
ncbi:MAG: 3-dehydroquinate synthase, partial [Caldimicrobium sp.]